MASVTTRWGGSPGGDDFNIAGEPEALASARQRLLPRPWTWLRQVHGPTVVEVGTPGEHAGVEADALVTTTPGAALAIHTADCVPVLLYGDAVVGAAHAGWQGLCGGVLEGTVAAMKRLGAVDITARLGPHIRAGCYEFGFDDLRTVARRYGDSVRSETTSGTPALDMTIAVTTALERVGAEVIDDGGCTACDPDRYFSHRARRDVGRHASVISITS